MITSITLNAAIDQVYEVESMEMGGTNRVSSITQDVGGKGMNVAKVLHYSGANVDVGGFAGGLNGVRIRSLLEKHKIASDLISVKGESRVCLTVLDKNKSEGTELLEGGPDISEAEWYSMLDWARQKSESVKWFALSGSLPKGVPPTAYADLIRIMNENGANVILDSSGEALQNGIMAKPFAIKPNEHEIAALLGKSIVTESELFKVGRCFVDAGIEHVCFTLAGEGAIFVNKSGCFKADAPQIDIVNTVGSGDAFVGGLLYGLSHDEVYSVAYKRAIACGSVNAMYSAIGFIDLEQVEAFMEQITIRKINDR